MTSIATLESLEPVGGTDAGRYYRLEPRIFVAQPRPGYSQTGEGAQRSLAELDRLVRPIGRKVAVIVLVDRVLSQDARSRRVWSVARPDETRCAQALVCGNVLARAIGSFFLGLNRGPVATKMFGTIDEAVRWSREMVERHDEPLV